MFLICARIRMALKEGTESHSTQPHPILLKLQHQLSTFSNQTAISSGLGILDSSPSAQYERAHRRSELRPQSTLSGEQVRVALAKA